MKTSFLRTALALGCLLGSVALETASAQVAPAVSRRLAAPQERVTVSDDQGIPASNVGYYPGPAQQQPTLSSRAAVAYRQGAPSPFISAQPASPMDPMTATSPDTAEAQPMPMGGGDLSTMPCDTCTGDVFTDPGRWFAPGRGSWVAGMEFLFARPHFSEPTAYKLEIGPIVGPGNQVSSSIQTIYHNYDYEPALRAYLAYRLCDCCSEVRLTYWGLDSNSQRSQTTNAAGNIVPTFFEVQPLPGDTLTARSDINGDVFDLDFSRCIINGDECCDPCDPCGGGCPRWDLQWSAGARLARWGYNNQIFTNNPVDPRVDIEMDFIGAGPKVGLEGRRYFGANNQFTVYSTLDLALILGWYEDTIRRTAPSVGANPVAIDEFISKITRTIPVTEIEVGTSWNFAPGWTLSGGWFFQAWWDLGMSEQQTSRFLGAAGGQVYFLDDSNIMSWDGLTAKLEFVW